MRAAAALRIHLVLLNQLPQTVGRAQRGTSTLRLCQRHLGLCRFPLQPSLGLRAPGPVGSRSPLLPSTRGQGLSGPLLPQPQSGSPQADALPRPCSSRAAPALSPPLPAAWPGEHGGDVGLGCVCVSVSHQALRGCCTGMLCLPGSVHSVKSNCLKAVVLGFVFFPCFPPSHFTQLERRCSLVSALVRVRAVWQPQPALIVRLIFLPLFVVFARRWGRVAQRAPRGWGR